MVFGINYLPVLEEFFNEIRMNIVMYIKSLLIGLIFYLSAPNLELADTLQANTTMTKHDIELASKIIDAFIHLFTSSIGLFLTLYITWRFDKWKKKRK